MEQAQKITDIVDAYKEKLTDKQYKDTLEAVGELMKVKIPEKQIYVRVRRIKINTTVYQESEETEDNPSGSQINILSATNEFRHSTCDNECECCDAKLKILEFKSELNETTEYLRVISDDDRDADIPQGRYTIPMFAYQNLKKHITLYQSPNILVYLDDNE